MAMLKQTNASQTNMSSLSVHEEEELIIQTLENHLRRVALGQTCILPRWAAW